MKRALGVLLVLMLVFVSVGWARAEITSPYTIDEKARVYFADMTAVSGYEGLENYNYEYVGGYLHITFTTTHHNCCFSSYPPLLYITALNPTSTTTPTVRATDTIFHLLAGTHGTDWYAYDVQFDATGYTTIVKKAGVTEIKNEHHNVSGQSDTDYVSVANNYNLAPSNLFSMAFTPRLLHEAVSGGSGGGEETTSTSGSGDRLRCVETTLGMYCPSEWIREWEIKEKLAQMAGLMQMLIAELSK